MAPHELFGQSCPRPLFVWAFCGGRGRGGVGGVGGGEWDEVNRWKCRLVARDGVVGGWWR
eukprot:268247-Chlamydomonas_euryale.AAC.1